MNQRDRKIFDIFISRIHQRFPEAEIIAFGSRARGNASDESDFDICIVLNHNDFMTNDMISTIAWETGFENDCVITTVIMNEYQFKEGPMSESALVKNIRGEGVFA